MKNKVAVGSLLFLIAGAFMLPAQAEEKVAGDTGREACQKLCSGKYEDCASKNPHMDNPNGRAAKLHGQLCAVERDRCIGDCK